jgi:hypothetical protein
VIFSVAGSTPALASTVVRFESEQAANGGSFGRLGCGAQPARSPRFSRKSQPSEKIIHSLIQPAMCGFFHFKDIMTTIHIEQDEQGIITVAVDDGEPAQVASAEEACAIVESALGGEQEAPPQTQGEEMMDQIKRGYQGPAKQGGYV